MRPPDLLVYRTGSGCWLGPAIGPPPPRALVFYSLHVSTSRGANLDDIIRHRVCVENPRDTAHLELGMLVMALGLPVTLAFNFPFFNIQSTQKPPAAAELRDALVAGSSDMDVIQLLVDQCIDARVPFRAVCTPTLF